MQRQNQVRSFINEFAEHEGFPLWDKAEIAPAKREILARGMDEPEIDSIVVIPLVLENTKYVNGFLAARVNDNSVGIWLYTKDKYTFYPYGTAPEGVTAENFVALLMKMDKQLFNHEEFELKDGKLFSPDQQPYTGTMPRLIKEKDSPETFGEMLVSQGTICLWVQTPKTCNCSKGPDKCFDWDKGCENCGKSFCFPVSEWGDGPFGPVGGPDDSFGSGSGSSSGNSVNGSNGNGGGGSDNTNTGINNGGNLPPCLTNGTRLVNGYYEPCEPGLIEPYVPIDTTTIGTIIDDIPTDSIPNVLSRACNNEMDSLFNWAFQNGNNLREQGAIMVRKDNNIYLSNKWPGKPGSTAQINYELKPGEELLGYFHTHPVDINYKLRSFFSDDDFYEFHKHARTKKGYSAMLECGNKRFAIVVEDVQKYQAFMTLEKIKKLNEKIIEMELLPDQPLYYTNGQQASINAAIQFFGSVANCGLSFYETNNPSKTNFIKVNP